MSLSYQEMEQILMKELRLYHHPIAVTWLFTENEVQDFKQKTPYISPVKPLTYCQWEVAARMQGKTVVGGKKSLDCTNAQVAFGWKELDEKEVKGQLKYCVSMDQTERFMRSRAHLQQDSLKEIAVGPLGKAVVRPHVVHFYCDNMQSYHLSIDYMAATDTHPLRPCLTMSAAACGGAVFSWQEKTFNMCPACSGSYNAGKTERGEVNVFIPGLHLEATVERLLQRIREKGSSSISRPGDPFPGADICKNCSLIVFKDGKEDENPCPSCKN